MEPNSTTTLQVTISGDPAPPPPTVILMRLRPLDNSGPGWHRPEPPPLTVRLLAVTRLPKLLVMPKQLIVRICALDLPANDILRIRKRLRVMNTGSGPLQAFAITECPWFIRVAQEQCDAKCLDPGPGSTVLNLDLLARSSTEIAIEVTIVTEEMWPKPQEDYERRRCITNELRFFDDQNIFLMSLPLQLVVEYPQISVEPRKIDFGYVMDGDRRNTFFTVMQTSFSATMEVVVECLGKDYQTWPPNLTLAPRCRERVYVQYIARYQVSPVEGLVKIRAFGSPGSWCAVAVQLRAQTSLDRATHLPVHDHTDDSHLLFD
ncbi:unnamed protein product [Leptosia nina]|uniref:Uncharacterized protein n=1 Tax=Leptosia nina TaxID=320188 RepID=A0AAV1K2H7_9NEOP